MFVCVVFFPFDTVAQLHAGTAFTFKAHVIINVNRLVYVFMFSVLSLCGLYVL